MAPVPDPSSSTNLPQAIAAIEAGLIAIKQGDYTQALALLQPNPLPETHPLHPKAQMGLVVAHAKTGNLAAAVELCRSLLHSQQPPIRQWATKTLANLAKQDPACDQAATSTVASTVDVSGFVPLASSIPEAQAEPTGFVPFEPAPPSSDRGSPEPELAAQPVPTQLPLSRRGVVPPPQGRPAPASGLIAKPTASQLPPFTPVWRNAARLPRGQSLGKVKTTKLWLTQIATAIALFWMVQTIVYSAANHFTIGLTRIDLLQYRRVISDPPTWSIIYALIALFLASRWLLDALMTYLYGMRSFSRQQLGEHSPEAAQLLQRICWQKRIPICDLGCLPTAEPIIFSYGCLPHCTRIVISQGLLEQLATDEIATLVAHELGHLNYWDTPLMSLAIVLMQVPYTLYWLLAEWGQRQVSPITHVSARCLAAISYGIYALLRWVMLWLSRQRLYFSDRAAAELTGNPNGYTRALMKLAIGIANTVQAQGRTSYLLEGFDLLMPLGHRTATTLGSLYPYTPLEPILAWDCTQPLRHWLCLNQAHPPTGDRLRLLALYARYWQLDSELDFDNATLGSTRRQPGLTREQWQMLLLQGAPFFGLGLGLAIAYLLSALGWIGVRLVLPQLSWMYGDSSLIWGLPLVGFSLGTFLRINPYFPDIQFFGTQTAEISPPLPILLKNPDAVPADSLTLQLQGQLIGRPGLSNDLSQDLLLHTETGIVRLHWLSRWGPIGNLFFAQTRPTDLYNQTLTVTGWFRRGATAWIDIETLRTPNGRTHRSDHPVWSTLLATIAALWGIWAIMRGTGF